MVRRRLIPASPAAWPVAIKVQHGDAGQIASLPCFRQVGNLPHVPGFLRRAMVLAGAAVATAVICPAPVALAQPEQPPESRFQPKERPPFQAGRPGEFLPGPPGAGGPYTRKVRGAPDVPPPPRDVAGRPNRNRPGPWDNDVQVYRVGQDGNATKLATFERAGVPTVARLNDDRLVAAHQYFPADDDANFDKVAVRFSSDEGKTWSAPQVMQLDGLPEGMRFPFDPTLVPLPDGRVRLYFTSLRGRRFEEDRPAIHSAISSDALHYTFEPGVRFAIEGRPVIDCAVVLHKGVFHLYAPDNGPGGLPGAAGPGRRGGEDRPREGAGYHAASSDGLHFTRQEDVRIEGRRRWLGNAQSDGKRITFFGTGDPGGPQSPGGAWMADSEDGAAWRLTDDPPRVPGADPGAVKLRDGSWLVVATGPPRAGTPGGRMRMPGAAEQPPPGRPPGPPGAGLSAVPTGIPCAASGEEGIAASVLAPVRPRFADGAPVVIHVTGGVQAGSAQGRPEYVGFGFVEIHFAFPGGGQGEQRSGGTYDFRGPNCIAALADVIRFATGRLADKQGRKIGDLAPGMKVLTHNCGIVGSSHGGNACGLAMAMFGQQFPDLAWYASMESPYGEGAVNVELGGHESGVNPAYDPQTGVLDLSRLAWSPDLSPGLFRKQMPTATRELKGAFFFDLNGDGRFSADADFPANCVVGDDGKGVKAWYSPRILAEAQKRKLIAGQRPPHIPGLEEAKEFWHYRDAAASIPEAVRKCPRLAVIVYANQRDHVQAAPDHGHILEQIEGFRRAKAHFVRLNPDRAYLQRVLAAGTGLRGPATGGLPVPGLGLPKAEAAIPDNPAGRAYDRSNIAEGLEPAVLPLGLCMQAAVCELADRVQADNWAANLDAVLFPDAPAAPGLPPRRGGLDAAPSPVEPGAPRPGRPPLGPAPGPARPEGRLPADNRPLRGEPRPPGASAAEGDRPAAPRLAQRGLTRRVAADAGSREAALLFCIGVHVEPFGATVSKLATASGGSRAMPPGRQQRPDFQQPALFQKHVADLRTLAELVERHGGKLTVQAQTPFTQVAADRRETLLGDLQQRGHEMALHFHEDAHLGRGCEALPVATWTAVMQEEIALLKQAGAAEVRYWSGGNLYPGVLDAAAAVGLQVMSDHKNPRQQRTDERLVGVNPWRPAGGPRENDVAEFARHDPHGKIIYLPDGQFPRVDFVSMRRSPAMGGDAGYFDFLTGALEDSLRAARADRVNVFHITVHSGEFRGPPGGKPFGVIDQWLGEVVAPLVQAGKLRWATFGQMAEAFRAWEKANPGADPRAARASADSRPSPAPPLAPPGPATQPRRGYISFVVNVHDWTRAAESADTLLRLVELFQSHKVRGDFYLTAPVVEAYAAAHLHVVTSADIVKMANARKR